MTGGGGEAIKRDEERQSQEMRFGEMERDEQSYGEMAKMSLLIYYFCELTLRRSMNSFRPQGGAD